VAAYQALGSIQRQLLDKFLVSTNNETIFFSRVFQDWRFSAIAAARKVLKKTS